MLKQIRGLFKKKTKVNCIEDGVVNGCSLLNTATGAEAGSERRSGEGEEEDKKSVNGTNGKRDENINLYIPSRQEVARQSQCDDDDDLHEEQSGDHTVASGTKDSVVKSEKVSEESDTSWSDVEDEEPEADFPEQKGLVGYKLINKIGEGAFSEVYRAIPLKDGPGSYLTNSYKQVAVKVINKKRLSTTSNKSSVRGKKEKEGDYKVTSREQVLKEITIHKTVSSGENIVTFIDFQETESHYFIVQELLEGGEIFGEIVRLTYFSEDLCRHVIRQLALAVKHMHSLGIVHRDIKPENLLFEPIDYIPGKRELRKSDNPQTKQEEGLFQLNIGGGGIGVVKLADFGLSKQIFATNTTTPCGTVGYTAPEVVKDERYSMKVDMWGIGCVLYTVLCGFPPFYDEKIDVLTELISKGQYTFLRPWWDEISPGAKMAVRRLLEVDPEKRYDIDEFLNDPWLNTYDCESGPSQEQQIKHHRHNHTRKPYKRDSSLLYSPAAVAMRDAFDISNAVQREGEAKRSSPGDHLLGALHEDDEESGPTGFKEIENNMFQLRLNSSTIIKRRNKGKSSPDNLNMIIPMTVEEI